MAEGRTYRRTPEDIEEARHIHALVKKDLEARVLELSQAGQLATLHKLLGYEARWKGIVSELEAPIAAKVAKPEPVADPPQGDAITGGEVAPGPHVPDSQETGPRRNRAAR